jgi:hypothetical protein
MDSQIYQIDKQASDDGDYHAHILSLIEIAKKIKEPTRALKEMIEQAEWAIENDDPDGSVFAELRDTILSEPSDDLREFLVKQLKSYLITKRPGEGAESHAKMAAHLADIVEDTLAVFE